MAQKLKEEVTISIMLVQNGYCVSGQMPTEKPDGTGVELSYCTHIFARDVHVLKFIRDLLPQLEAFEAV